MHVREVWSHRQHDEKALAISVFHWCLTVYLSLGVTHRQAFEWVEWEVEQFIVGGKSDSGWFQVTAKQFFLKRNNELWVAGPETSKPSCLARFVPFCFILWTQIKSWYNRTKPACGATSFRDAFGYAYTAAEIMLPRLGRWTCAGSALARALKIAA